MRILVLTAALWSAALGAAQAADGPIATAPDRAAIQAETDAQIEAYLSRPLELDAPPAALPGPRQMHGEVGASIGTGGYRSAYGVVDMPFGEANNLGVAVQSTRFPSRRGWGGGTSQSVAVNLSINGPLGLGSKPRPDCMPRTGTRLPSDDRNEAECARLKDKATADH